MKLTNVQLLKGNSKIMSCKGTGLLLFSGGAASL